MQQKKKKNDYKIKIFIFELNNNLNLLRFL